MTTLMIDRTPQERLVHHAQILSILATLVVLTAIPLAVVALVIEAVVYVRFASGSGSRPLASEC